MPKNILEVDESIIKNNLLLPETREEDDQLNSLLKTLETPEIPSITFRPSPGVCVKTTTDKGDKVFINICQTTEIPPPEEISAERFQIILDEDNPSWCIPMSVGHERFEPSKNGTPSLTYDIALNTNFFKKIQAEKPFFLFTVLTMFSAIEEKHNKTLNTDQYVILKNRKVFGTLHKHTVQKREVRKPILPKQLIQEISQAERKRIEENPSLTTRQSTSEQYILLRKPKRGNLENLVAFFKLPNQTCIKDISVNMSQDRVVIDSLNSNYFVDIFLPHLVNHDKVVGTMDPNLQVLRLDMPVISS